MITSVQGENMGKLDGAIFVYGLAVSANFIPHVNPFRPDLCT